MTALIQAVLLIGFAAGLIALIFLTRVKTEWKAARRIPPPRPGDVNLYLNAFGRYRVEIAMDVNGIVISRVLYIGIDPATAYAVFLQAKAESARMRHAERMTASPSPAEEK